MSTVASEESVSGGNASAIDSTASAALPLWRRAMVFGTGFGIAIGERNLEAAIVKARPSGVTLVATATIYGFRNRPAAEWGAELLKFVAASGETRLAATPVLLPRSRGNRAERQPARSGRQRYFGRT